jgi:hypothetical protein
MLFKVHYTNKEQIKNKYLRLFSYHFLLVFYQTFFVIMTLLFIYLKMHINTHFLTMHKTISWWYIHFCAKHSRDICDYDSFNEISGGQFLTFFTDI